MKVTGRAVDIERLIQLFVVAKDFQSICVVKEGILIELFSLFKALVSLVLEVFCHLYDMSGKKEKVILSVLLIPLSRSGIWVRHCP